MLVKMNLDSFIEELASSSPAPGGGSVAAFSGALGAGLVSMVSRLTIGKKGYEEYEDLAKEILEKSEIFSSSLLKSVDDDTNAFNGVMAAFKMPKETEEEKSARKEAIQKGFKEAVQSPLHIAEDCLDVLKLAEQFLGKCNENAISDIGVASQQAYAGLEGAVMNVRINLPSIKDEEFVTQISKQIDELLEEGKALKETVYTHVQEKLS